MSSQWLRKGFNEAPDLASVVVFGKTSPRVLVEGIESRRERSMLLYVVFHDAFDSCYLLYVWKEILFFRIVVVVHGLRPALAVCQKVSTGLQVFAWYVRCLQVNGVQTTDDAVVGKCHLRCNIVCSMGRLQWYSE